MMNDYDLTIIAAMDENRVIGKNNSIPWNISEEMEHFQDTTFGHPVIMGRKTFESISGFLPGRATIVLTENDEWEYNNNTVTSARNKDEAIEKAMRVAEVDNIFIAGGQSVYEQFIDECDKMIISYIEGEYDGDTYFPEFDLDNWDVKFRQTNNKFNILEYERS